MDDNALQKLLGDAHISKEMKYAVASVVNYVREVQLSDVIDFLPAIQKIDEVIPFEQSHSGNFKAQAFFSLVTIDDKNRISRNPQPRKQVLSDFITLITPEAKDTPFTGHSVSVEWEPYAATQSFESECCELRIGPFRNYQNLYEKLDILHRFSCLNEKAPLSTLHLNWGLTPDQCNRYIDYPEIYPRILKKLSYLSNSAARNLYMKALYDSHAAATKYDNFQDCSGEKDDKKKQVLRLECKDFSVAEDGDIDMVKFTIPAFQRALDDVASAKKLNDDLDALFKTAGIVDDEGKLVVGVPDKDTQDFARQGEYDLAVGGHTIWQPEIDKVKAYEADFGIRPKKGGPATGRVIGYRPIVNYYLQSFIAKQEAEELPGLLATTQALRKKYEENTQKNRHLTPHKNAPEGAWEERISKGKNSNRSPGQK